MAMRQVVLWVWNMLQVESWYPWGFYSQTHVDAKNGINENPFLKKKKKSPFAKWFKTALFAIIMQDKVSKPTIQQSFFLQALSLSKDFPGTQKQQSSPFTRSTARRKSAKRR